MKRNDLTIYTDGACSGTTGGIGVVYEKNREIIYTFNKKIANTTNNKCELLAVIYALKSISKPIDRLVIYTDSAYVEGLSNNNWKAKTNTKYVELLRSSIQQTKLLCSELKICWLKGHRNNIGNNLADKLAVEARLLVD